MYHLGIAYGHNATVAVIRDGELVFCQSEERLSRVKNTTGFPDLTLAHVYQHVCRPDEVGSCVFFQGGNRGWLAMRQAGFKTGPLAHALDPAAIRRWQADPAAAQTESDEYRAYLDGLTADPALNREAALWFGDRVGLPLERIIHLDHHLSHAVSSIPFLAWSPAEPTLIFTLDGEGDSTCATVSSMVGGRLTELDRTPELLSLGRIYATVTGILGFKINEHEYKIMGLAPYAKPEYHRDLAARFHDILTVGADGQWRASYRTGQDLMVRLVELCTFQRFDAVAGALQAYTEEVMCRWIGHWIARTGIGSIACAGGVFMNVKANQRVLALDGVARMTVVPSCGDESTAIGCAVHGSRLAQPAAPIRRVESLYLGQAFGPAEIRPLLEDLRGALAIEEPADLAGRVARLLADGEVVARCSGRAEFGARALGNRSILSHPARVENVAVINDAIKNRDFWMPFAPTVLEEALDELVVGHDRMFSPFMMASFDATPRGREVLAAALHRADFTLRPQMLRRAANPAYHDLVSRFRDLTGIGALLNTSFNLHGEPIVGSPADAIRTMRQSGLRHLVLDRYLLSKP